MASRIPAYVNHEMLVWARGQAGYAIEQVADAMKLPLAKVASWEANEAQPSLRQAEGLAKLYDMSFSVFSLPKPPDVKPISSEHRRLPGVRPGSEPPQLRKATRRLIRRRKLALHLLSELGDDFPEFRFTCRLDENPEAVAHRLREALEVSVEAQLQWQSEYIAFRAWRSAVEGLGVLVCQFPGKELEAIRGTSIVQFPLPVVAISSKELPLSKPFTLVHEVVHLGLSMSHEEGPAASDNRSEGEWLQVERFCESVAAAVLMPEAAVKTDEDLSVASRGDNVDAVRRMARHFKVTPTAMATRLLWLKFMAPGRYNNWKSLWESYCRANPAKPGFGIATPAEKAVTRAGPLFTSLVLSALSYDRITAPAASDYLGISFEHVAKLREGWISAPSSLANAILA